MSKTPHVRRRKSSTETPPQFNMPRNTGGAGFIFGALFWILMIIVGIFMFYVQLFSFNLTYILNLFNFTGGRVPFWFSILICIFLFPVSLGVILIGILLRILKGV